MFQPGYKYLDQNKKYCRQNKKIFPQRYKYFHLNLNISTPWIYLNHGGNISTLLEICVISGRYFYPRIFQPR